MHCRVCKAMGGAYGARLEAAHIIGRECDKTFTFRQKAFLLSWPKERSQPWKVAAERIVPLCSGNDGCHGKYDRHELDLLSFLSLDEQVQAVADAGGIALAFKRTAPTLYRSEAAA